MNYAKIRSRDVANGPGLRVSIWVQGCKFNCPGCFNKEQQDFSGGKLFDQKTRMKFLMLGSDPMIDGFSILGGEIRIYKG